ncbi:XRE family transcriptional regulator [Limosilactobacillus agrestis]|uniref:XRE family transcriptional regulator n=1 Tax=Limosilactobacillus agrestis TaxID=2759748 RepID=UPI001E4EABF9|nr:XRE family transcriptional regulator [Limosilactobacillus agrestis]MCD7120830.1 XRE family transcriptional regulator [Limosilactobacillus agrestis]
MTVYTAVKTIAKSQGKSIYRIERDLGFGNGMISKWNKSIPRADKLQAVADYLGTTPQYLLRLAKEEK